MHRAACGGVVGGDDGSSFPLPAAEMRLAGPNQIVKIAGDHVSIARRTGSIAVGSHENNRAPSEGRPDGGIEQRWKPTDELGRRRTLFCVEREARRAARSDGLLASDGRDARARSGQLPAEGGAVERAL